jgi:hypothetical protein
MLSRLSWSPSGDFSVCPQRDQRVVNNPLSDGFTVNHQVVRESGTELITEFGIGRISRFSAA